jgi:uncharacterized protein (TIGR03437 family)
MYLCYFKVALVSLLFPWLIFPASSSGRGEENHDMEVPGISGRASANLEAAPAHASLFSAGSFVLTGDTNPFECDVTIRNSIDDPVERDYFVFSAVDNERVHITFANSTPAGPNFGIVWRLLKGDGTPATECGDISGAARDCGRLLASESPYRVEVSDFQSNDTGAYFIHLQRLTAATACENVPLACSVTYPGTIDSQVDTDLLSFSVADGERVNVTFANSTPAGPNFGVVWRILKGDGTPASPCGEISGAARDCGPLPASGNPYRIEVSDFQFNGAGAYLIHLQRLTAGAACPLLPLDCDVTVTRALDSLVDTDLHSFSVADGERVNVTFANSTPAEPNFGVVWRLLRGDGTPASACGDISGAARDCGPLPASGNPYRVEISDFQLNGAGAYLLHLQRLTAATACDNTPLICGVTSRSTIDSPIDTDLHSFSVAGGERVNINFTNTAPVGPNFGVVWRLLQGDGAPASQCGDISGAARDCGPLPASGNPYRIEISDFQFNGTGAYSLAVNFLTTGCSAITLAPNPLTVAVGTSGNMTVTITPAQSTGTVVALSSSNSGTAKVPDSVTIPANQPSASFAVMGMSAGPATITATLPPSLGSRTATASVAVFSPGTAQIEIIQPSPTTNDYIYARISGSWPNTCAPLSPMRTIMGSEIRIATSGAGQGCAQAATNWSQTVDIGQLEVGVYTVIVTYNGAEIGRRTFNVTPPPTPRAVRVVGVNATPGGSGSVPIELAAQGDENALGFTLTFDRNVLGNPQAALGADAIGAVLNQNPNQAGQGRFGIALSLPAGQVFTAGTRRIVIVTFTVAAGAAAGSTPIGFTDQPIAREVVDVSARTLPATFTPGMVTISTGLEADVAPRGNPNGAVTISDWVQVGRFAAGLDTASPGSEFQRADCAPRATLGNGGITISDWVQAGRYAAGLDPPTPAGGPTSPTSASAAIASANATAAAEQPLRAIKSGFEPGPTGSLSVSLDAQGDEQALGFSLRYDPTQVRFISAQAGRDAAGATLYVNAGEAASGRVGIALSLPTGQTFAAGAQQAVTVTFATASDSSGSSATIEFADHPIAREIADADARPLPVSWVSGPVAIHARAVTSVSAASFRGSPLAVESIVAAFGSHLAVATEAATMMPLPTELAGTRVVIRDSAGAEHLAPLLYVSSAQVNYQIPAGTASGEAVITIISGDGAVSIGSAQIAAAAPGLFTANADGQGLAAAVAVRVKPDGTQTIEPIACFDEGQGKFVSVPIDLGPETDQVFLILFGTGFRSRSALGAVILKIGGVDQQVLYAAEPPGFVGLDQLNVRLTRSLIGRGEVDVSLSVDGKTANTVRVSIK